jgi:hypothetical protein
MLTHDVSAVSRIVLGRLLQPPSAAQTPMESHLDEDVLEVGVLPRRGRVRNHDEGCIVILIVLHVQEHQLRPVVVLLAHLRSTTCNVSRVHDQHPSAVLHSS